MSGRLYHLHERDDSEADNDTDSDDTSIDGVVAHRLEDNTGNAHGEDNGGKTGLKRDNISSATSGVSGTLNSNTDFCTRNNKGVSHDAQMAEGLGDI